MALIKDLLSAPRPLPAVSIYTIINGVFYLGNGATLLLWPGIAQVMFFEPPFVGHEAGLARVIGLLLCVVGWLYLFGGRSGSRQFVAAGAIDRIFLVPAVLVPVALSGTFPHLLLIFAVVDPLLGLGAWWLLSRR
jgi:hypothetical protein